MSHNTYESWEDEEQVRDQELTQQAANLSLQQQQQQQQRLRQQQQQQAAYTQNYRPNAFSNSFQPGAQSFTPRQQQYDQGYYHQQPGANGSYDQRSYGGYDQYQSSYNQYGYSGYGQMSQPRSYERPSAESQSQPPEAAKPNVLQPRVTTSSTGPKVLKIGGGASPAPKVNPPAASETASTTDGKPEVKSSESKTEANAEGVDAAAKVTAARAVDGTKTPTGRSSPTPSGSSTPPKSEKKDVIKQQEEEIDDELVEELYGKEHVNVIFIGHVDAGKSTMGGNILFLTGMVDKRTMEKYEKDAKEAGRESWYLSWALDLTKEERSKGKTVEVGRAYFETEKRRYTILDAPGHKSFVPNMIGGASQADVGVLVISARKGEYETGFEKGGQTREHAVLAKTQGVNKLVVAVNKMDDPTVLWSKERYDECIAKLNTFLRGLGYNPKTDLTFLPLSAYNGAGLKDRVTKDVCDWYDGPSLLEVLDNMVTLERKVKAPLMMPINGKYKDMGTVVEGKIESGGIKRNHNAIIMPNKHQVEVTAIYNETEDEISAAACGEQVRLRLRGIEEEDVQQGFVLCSLKNPVRTVTAFEAQVAILELRSLLSAGFTCVMHVHAAIEEVTFSALLHKLEKTTNRKSKKAPGFATKGMKIIARLESTSGEPFCVERFEDYPQLGRFTLRDQGTTIAIGKVTKLCE